MHTAATSVLHPGQVLQQQFLAPCHVSVEAAAACLKIEDSVLRAFIAGESGVTNDFASRLAWVFGKSPAYWVRLQSEYELSQMDPLALDLDEDARLEPYYWGKLVLSFEATFHWRDREIPRLVTCAFTEAGVPQITVVDGSANLQPSGVIAYEHIAASAFLAIAALVVDERRRIVDAVGFGYFKGRINDAMDRLRAARAPVLLHTVSQEANIEWLLHSPWGTLVNRAESLSAVVLQEGSPIFHRHYNGAEVKKKLGARVRDVNIQFGALRG